MPPASDFHEGQAIATPEQLGVALGFQGGEGSADDAIAVAIDLEARFKSPGCGCVEPIGAAGGLQGPVGIEAPDVEKAGGVVAPEDLVDAGDGVSGQRLPLAAVTAGRADTPGGNDLLPPASDFHEGHAIAAPEQLGVALGFQGGVVIEDRAHHRSRGADAVSAACSEGEGNGFIGLNFNISRGIDYDRGGGGVGGKDHRLGGGGGGDSGVIDAQGGGAGHGVIHRQGGCGGACAGKGIDQIGGAIFSN